MAGEDLFLIREALFMNERSPRPLEEPTMPQSTPRRLTTSVEQSIEQFLWTSRLAVLVAVAASVITGFAMFYLATIDVLNLANPLGAYTNSSPSDPNHEAIRTQVVGHIVEIIDGYLLATILLIFAFGLYELFISRIDVAERSGQASRILMIRTLDDLKDRLAKVVLLILVVKFFEHSLQMTFEKPLDLVYLSVGMLFIAGALYLGHKRNGRSEPG